MRRIFFGFFVVALFLPFFVSAVAPIADLALSTGEITLSEKGAYLTKNQIVRLYATVVNLGQADSIGQVQFFLNDAKLIGEASVSLKASSVKDEVFVDFAVPAEDFYVTAKIVSVSPNDENLSNNNFTTQTYHVRKDSDGDGLYDDEDNDDDNDGLIDEQELAMGTDKNNKDTDNDGVIDLLDVFPLDPARSKEEPKPAVKVDFKNVPQLPNAVPAKSTAAKPAVKKSEAKPLIVSGDDKKEAENTAELVESFYDSPEVEMLNEIKIQALPTNWNTYDFSFTTNVAGLDVDKLYFLWMFSDGKTSTENGEHKFRGLGDFFVTLKVKGSFGNYLFDNVKVKVAFWSVYNYWLWLIVLAVSLAVVVYGRGFQHASRQELSPVKPLRQPRKRKAVAVDEEEVVSNHNK